MESRVSELHTSRIGALLPIVSWTQPDMVYTHTLASLTQFHVTPAIALALRLALPLEGMA